MRKERKKCIKRRGKKQMKEKIEDEKVEEEAKELKQQFFSFSSKMREILS